jgi:hypothetical protein
LAADKEYFHPSTTIFCNFAFCEMKIFIDWNISHMVVFEENLLKYGSIKIVELRIFRE